MSAVNRLRWGALSLALTETGAIKGVILIICSIRVRDVPFIYPRSKAEGEKPPDVTGSIRRRMAGVIAFVAADTWTRQNRIELVIQGELSREVNIIISLSLAASNTKD